jgi:hypothetical protein
LQCRRHTGTAGVARAATARNGDGGGAGARVKARARTLRRTGGRRRRGSGGARRRLGERAADGAAVWANGDGRRHGGGGEGEGIERIDGPRGGGELAAEKRT